MRHDGVSGYVCGFFVGERAPRDVGDAIALGETVWKIQAGRGPAIIRAAVRAPGCPV
ncbi:hypothetical protein BCCH1_09240 [Burkholderia contaminans]|uniref:Uncharacterized protein n=1 Tax=Burkholderia contaminans TaxID=488447 RepID=A0A250L1E7_9BURK|nr:hypothetical protein BCCH1_09240 [Burkholderia contaminans]GLZ67931.1 hypothetical protein Bcon01_09760 [Burkholderia contaminans]